MRAHKLSLAESNLEGLGARYSPRVHSRRKRTALSQWHAAHRHLVSRWPARALKPVIQFPPRIHDQKFSHSSVLNKTLRPLWYTSESHLQRATSRDSQLKGLTSWGSSVDPAVAIYSWWTPQHRPLCVMSVLTLTISMLSSIPNSNTWAHMIRLVPPRLWLHIISPHTVKAKRTNTII